MFGNPKGELRICPDCNRKHDILRGTGCICACEQKILSKEYSREKTIEINLNIKIYHNHYQYIH